ncbi:hypothetical protein LP419_02305 [Massilia sp. H-1]|nr:hypothetical protein LP419_02305 [Massilia sp. H-1]
MLAAVTMLGSVYSGEFPQASHAESTGFDALAHNLFADVLGPDDEAESK